MSVVYSVRNISKRFGPTVALEDVSLDVRKGAILGLVGMNGAGKSTLLRIVAGAMAPDSGDLLVDGDVVALSSTAEADRHGIAIVSQELSLFPALTVEENLRLGSSRRKWSSTQIFRDEARRVLREIGFGYDLADKVDHLGLADRQLVEIGRALLQRPRVLILDEPTSALHAAEVARLHEQIRRLRDAGVAIVYVSHFLEDLLDICDEVVVLRNGRRVEAPDIAGADALPDLVQAMLGDAGLPAQQPAARMPRTDAGRNVPLVIRGLRGPNGLRVDELEVSPGEIVGLAGLVGSGIEDLFRVLFGFAGAASTEVVLPSGKPLQKSPADAVAAGVAYTPADRKALGLMQRQSIVENVVSVRVLGLGRDGIFPRMEELRKTAMARCRETGVKLSSVDQRVSELSGGNQQKVVFAKWLEANPSLLLLDDPTRGIDIRAREEIHRIIHALADSGMTILFYSSDPGETVDIADRVAVFVDGMLAAVVSGEDASEHNVVTLMNSAKSLTRAV